jgi:hypothetical protein
MGNGTARRSDDAVALDRPDGGAAELGGRFDPTAYLAPGSDVVALLVLGHQTRVHNLVTRAGFEALLALRDEAALAEALGQPAAEGEREATKRRIQGAAEPLVEALLFSGEAALDRPIAGGSPFARAYVARGPRDARGRSLRDLDLRRRLLRHPLSPLVYSAAFDGLPAPVRRYVYRRLWEVLSGADRTRPFAHLSGADRRAILEILRETKPGLPDYFHARKPPAG